MASTSENIFYGGLGNWQQSSGKAYWAAWISDYSVTRSGTDSVKISGTMNLRVTKEGTIYGIWYADNISYQVKIGGGDYNAMQEIKPWTNQTVLEGITYTSSFEVTGSVAASSGTADVTAYFKDTRQTYLDGWVNDATTWTISVPLGVMAPTSVGASVSNVTCSSASFAVSASGGVGSTTYIKVEYGTDSNLGKTSSATTGSSISITNLEPGTTYYYRGYAYNNTGGIRTEIKSFTTKGSSPSLGTPTATNPQVYRAVFTMPSVDWGECGSGHTLTLNWNYTADGTTYYYSRSWSGSSTTSATYDTGQLIPTASQYFTAVPDDETINYTWTATKQFGSRTASAVKTGTLYCQPSYTAYVIEAGVNNGNPVEAEMFVGGTGQKPTSKIRRVDTIG